MKQRTAKVMSLKGKVKNISKEKNISAQLVLQNFMMERFLNRLAISEHKDNFIVKGGSLISVLLGIEKRTTMDIDVTIRNFNLIEYVTEKIIKEICSIKIDDDVIFEYKRCEPIRDDDIYGGLRVFIDGFYDGKSIQVPFTIDVSTGDIITPAPQKQKWNCLMNDENVFELWTYSIETILAEKIEAILSRGVISTRPRDYYDVYMITKTKTFDKDIFKTALKATCEHRGSLEKIKYAIENFSVIENSKELEEFWSKYSSKNSYAQNLSYDEVVKSVKELIFLHTD